MKVIVIERFERRSEVEVPDGLIGDDLKEAAMEKVNFDEPQWTETSFYDADNNEIDSL